MIALGMLCDSGRQEPEAKVTRNARPPLRCQYNRVHRASFANGCRDPTSASIQQFRRVRIRRLRISMYFFFLLSASRRKPCKPTSPESARQCRYILGCPGEFSINCAYKAHNPHPLPHRTGNPLVTHSDHDVCVPMRQPRLKQCGLASSCQCGEGAGCHGDFCLVSYRARREYARQPWRVCETAVAAMWCLEILGRCFCATL
jgi:hypothetical protein